VLSGGPDRNAVKGSTAGIGRPSRKVDVADDAEEGRAASDRRRQRARAGVGKSTTICLTLAIAMAGVWAAKCWYGGRRYIWPVPAPTAHLRATRAEAKAKQLMPGANDYGCAVIVGCGHLAKPGRRSPGASHAGKALEQLTTRYGVMLREADFVDMPPAPVMFQACR